MPLQCDAGLITKSVLASNRPVLDALVDLPRAIRSSPDEIRDVRLQIDRCR